MTISARIGWWNTGLTRPSQSTSAVPNHLKLAAEVVREILVDPMSLDVLALGEVAQTDVQTLLEATGDPDRFARVFNAGRNLAIVYDTKRVVANGDQALTAYVFGKPVEAGHWIELAIDDAPLAMAAVHWPSRVVPQGRNGRIECARMLQGRFRQAIKDNEHAAVLILGDFNDEPFDESLTLHLQGTRDRTAVQRNNDLLYNPFWRLLGENQALSAAGPLSSAGSHFWMCQPSTDWYTFDQALVSSSLLRGNGWTLIEEATTIVSVQRLRTRSLRFRYKFDHLPIAMQLEYRVAPLPALERQALLSPEQEA